MTQQAAFEPSRFREVLGHYPTGVVLVTGVAPDGELLAMIVGTFNSVSLEPPLVSFMPMLTSKTFERLLECSSMCINVLSGAQESTARAIARRHTDKFEDVDWTPSPSGDPILAGTVAWLDVRMDQLVEAGDHYIALCAVVDMDVPNPVAPLIFFQGGYGTFVIPSLIARMEADIVPAVQAAECVRDELADLAGRIDCEVSLLYRANPDELVSVASAVGPSVGGASGLGQRIPVLPPFADIFIAEEDAEGQQRWLSRAVGAGEDLLNVYRGRLEFARQNGYLMSFVDNQDADPYAGLSEAMRHYAAGSITPAQERQISAIVASSSLSYAAEPIRTDHTYDIGSLVVAVHDTTGRAVHCVRLAHLPRARTGTDVNAWIRDLLTTAGRLEQKLAGPRA